MSSVVFHIQNSRTWIDRADPFILDVLDQELRYPDQIAATKALGIQLPGESDWDGWYRMLHVPKTLPPWFPTGLTHYAGRICQKMGYQVLVQDKRERPDGDVPEFVQIGLRDYQEQAVRQAIKIGRGVLDMPPRSGKTRTMCEIHRQLALPTIWMAPTDRIATQTHKILEGFFDQRYSFQLIGAKKEEEAARSRVVVCTASTAARLSPEFYKTRKVVVVDEWHHSAARTYRELFQKCDHVYHRYGMTGTWFRSGDDAMAMHALISDPIFKISSLELLQRGYLVPCHTVFVPVPCPHLRGVGSSSYNTGHGKMGIHEHKIRNQVVAHTALFLYQTDRKVLILVGTKKQGYMIRNILKALLPTPPDRAQFNTVEFVSTDVDRHIQGQILESFEDGQEVKVLIGTSLLGEGVDLPTTDALVYARGEKAEVTLMQSIYRVSTAVEGKSHAVVVDFADRHHRKLLYHSRERLRVHYEEPTFSVTVLNNIQEFPEWINSSVPSFVQAAS